MRRARPGSAWPGPSQPQGIRCEVAAPSKIQRPAGDRVRTDARDAMLLARLLRLDDIVSVTVASVEREAARDLVRAREDVRGDLMRARHRVSKLLLRRGIVYYGGHAWTGTHLVWLRRKHFDAPGLQVAFDAEHEAVLQAEARRDRLDKAIEAMAADSEYTPVVHRLGCLRGIATLTWVRAGCRNRGLGPAHRLQHRRIPGLGAHRVLAGSHVPRGRSPRQGTPMPAGCWSRPAGSTASPTGPPARG